MTTLAEWLRSPGASEHMPITTVAGRVGIHDSRAIERERWELWNLSDYRVDTVQAGVIWLVKRRTLEETIERARDEATRAGQMRIVYRALGNYSVAATLPVHGTRVGNYYPEGYTCDAGWYPVEGEEK